MLLMAVLVPAVLGQGLEMPMASTKVMLGASRAYDQLATTTAFARRFIRDYNTRKSSVCGAGGGAGRSLCAAAGSSGEDQRAAMMVATSPMVYSSASAADTGIANFVAPAKDQRDCHTCVAFVVAGAAEVAVAAALGRAGSTFDLSERQLFYCPKDPKAPRLCYDPWNLRDALQKFLEAPGLVKEGCLPYGEDADGAAAACSFTCNSTYPELTAGSWDITQIKGFAVAQRHIRRFGAIMSPFYIYSDMRPFFKTNPKGVYPGNGTGAKMEEAHAILIVGYDNEGGYWIARNSWGPTFADNGFFRVKFGACGIAMPGETYGLLYYPSAPRPVPPLSPIPSQPGCFSFKAGAASYASQIADNYGIPVGELLASNPQLTMIGPTLRASAFLKPGQAVTVCNPTKNAPSGAAAAAAPAAAAATAAPAVGGQDVKFKGYRLTETTAQVVFAGTDSRITYKIEGAKGASGELGTSGSRNAGDVLTFDFQEVPDLGDLKNLTVTSDGAGLAAGWLLDSVTVEAPSTGRRWKFAFNKWVESPNLSQVAAAAPGKR